MTKLLIECQNFFDLEEFGVQKCTVLKLIAIGLGSCSTWMRGLSLSSVDLGMHHGSEFWMAHAVAINLSQIWHAPLEYHLYFRMRLSHWHRVW